MSKRTKVDDRHGGHIQGCGGTGGRGGVHGIDSQRNSYTVVEGDILVSHFSRGHNSGLSNLDKIDDSVFPSASDASRDPSSANIDPSAYYYG